MQVVLSDKFNDDSENLIYLFSDDFKSNFTNRKYKEIYLF